jgi:hypothetical protein
LTTSRLSIWLLCAGAVALACGPRARDAASRDSSAAATASRAGDGTVIASSLDVSVGTDVRLTLHVTNSSDSTVELRFPSGQTHDFAVVDSTGREVWRWSADRMFTQALQTRTLAAGHSLTYEERWSPGSITGALTAVGRLASVNLPVEKRVEFTLP